MTEKALITCHHLQRHFELFRQELAGYDIAAHLPPIPGQQFDAIAMRKHVEGSSVIIAGDDIIDAGVLEAGRASGLKAIVKWGVGTDGIDKAHAGKIGVPIYNTPGAFSDEVADLAMCYLLMLTRRLHDMHTSVLNGGWLQIEGRSLSAMTAGIIGMGSIGMGIARRCNAAGMRVLGYDIRAIPKEEQLQASLTQLDFKDMLGQSDVVFVACNLTPDNHHMMNAEAFETMPFGSYIINVGRGPMVDEAALTAAILSGQIRAAGLDVFENEPLAMDSPLRNLTSCVFGTHSGSNTTEAVHRINRMTIDIMLDVLGRKPLHFKANRVA